MQNLEMEFKVKLEKKIGNYNKSLKGEEIKLLR